MTHRLGRITLAPQSTFRWFDLDRAEGHCLAITELKSLCSWNTFAAAVRGARRVRAIGLHHRCCPNLLNVQARSFESSRCLSPASAADLCNEYPVDRADFELRACALVTLRPSPCPTPCACTGATWSRLQERRVAVAGIPDLEW